MLIPFVLFSFLFIVGLLTTLLNFPTKKFTSLLHSFLPKTTPPPPAPLTNKEAPTMAQNKVINTGSATELKGIFATFDKNKDGFITKQELSQSLKNIGMSITDFEVSEIIEKADFNKDGLIDFDEFCELMTSQDHHDQRHVMEGAYGKEDGEEDLKEAFDVFDGDGDGLISVEELGLVLNSLGFNEGKKLESCKEMIKQVDMDGDGMVNFDEFKNMMRCGVRLIPIS